MNDIMTQTEDQTANPTDALSMLKQRARLMGIQFSNNIGIEALRERIDQKMDSDKSPEPAQVAAPINALTGEVKAHVKPMTEEQQIRHDLQRDELKLIRLRISNLDPKKKGLPGEIFTVANEFLGTVKKFVPYGEFTEDGYHVPYIIYRQLQERKFLHIQTTTNKLNGQLMVKSAMVKEFSLEVLPPLTQDELTSLAAAQAAAGIFGTD